MNRPLVIAAALASLFASSVASAAVTAYSATLTGAQVVPASRATGTATAALEFDDVQKLLTGTITLSGFSPTKQRVQSGGICGANGASNVDDLNPPFGDTITIPSTGAGSLQLSVFNQGMLIGGGMYITLQSASGDIRGQIYKTSDAKTCAGSDAGAPVADAAPPADAAVPEAGSAPVDASSPADASSGPSPSAESPSSSDGGCAVSQADASSGGFALASVAFALTLGAARRRKARKAR